MNNTSQNLFQSFLSYQRHHLDMLSQNRDQMSDTISSMANRQIDASVELLKNLYTQIKYDDSFDKSGFMARLIKTAIDNRLHLKNSLNHHQSSSSLHKQNIRRLALSAMALFGIMSGIQASNAIETAANDGALSSRSNSSDVYQYYYKKFTSIHDLVEVAFPNERDLGHRPLTTTEHNAKVYHYDAVKQMFSLNFYKSDSDSSKFSPTIHKELQQQYRIIGESFVSILQGLKLTPLQTYNDVSLSYLLSVSHDSALRKGYLKLGTEEHTSATRVLNIFNNSIAADDYESIERYFAKWTTYVLQSINSDHSGLVDAGYEESASASDDGNAQIQLLVRDTLSKNTLAELAEALKDPRFQQWLDDNRIRLEQRIRLEHNDFKRNYYTPQTHYKYN